MTYKYGMRLRGFAPGCQPMEGLTFVMQTDRGKEKYWSVLGYDRKLTEKEMKDYELDFIGVVNDGN